MNVYQIPSPEERSKIFEKMVRDHQKLTDQQFFVMTRSELALARTELTGIMGYLSMLAVGDFGPISDEQKKIIEDLVESCGWRIASVNNLLQLTKMQSEGKNLFKREQPQPRPKILIFEDEKMLADMYATKLQMAGFEVAKYYDPTKDPVSVALKERPDLISSGVIMPEMDGFQALSLLKADLRTKDIPVVLLTNLGQDGDVAKGIELGATKYFIKAKHTPSEIVEEFCKILKLPPPVYRELPDVQPSVQPKKPPHQLPAIVKYVLSLFAKK